MSTLGGFGGSRACASGILMRPLGGSVSVGCVKVFAAAMAEKGD